ncbi:MAG TPA: F0F1 ATP synthase subunit delta [Segeticoccus sp.]|uniref:F0F1 ATP synthase subunit delta n=1 Tax=Segeticoccus sp. TaxID=2706531 RepID=UPI002D7F4BE1|nr:F0F1 ATP synthase subunit delta [Segeticoccus sp.]HET8601034.1 F0F1 ATP synthase subunit delta [Segeticoccus sp.]
MLGSSRAAVTAGRDALAAALHSGVDWNQLAEELFAVTAAVDGNAALRRALVDPSREGAPKRQLVTRLFSGKVSTATAHVLETLVSQRWSRDRDLADTVENLGVEAVVACAEAGERLDAVEDELFRFGRLVAGTPDLRRAVNEQQASTEARADLVERLLEGRTAPETVRLVRHAVVAPRGRRFDRIVEGYLSVIARRREQLTATVFTARALESSQRERLARALARIYDRMIQVNVVVDPDVLGGLRIHVGDEVIDGTILRRLDEARRQLAG